MRIHKTIQLVVRLGGPIVILEFPEIVYLTSNGDLGICDVLMVEAVITGEVNKLVMTVEVNKLG